MYVSHKPQVAMQIFLAKLGAPRQIPRPSKLHPSKASRHGASGGSEGGGAGGDNSLQHSLHASPHTRRVSSHTRPIERMAKHEAWPHSAMHTVGMGGDGTIEGKAGVGGGGVDGKGDRAEESLELDPEY
mmetsp:Transcript_11790/g.36432  ORF Transcript_11790/g.36432 Transcript_11790/m.36432 type:complete len:129 (-) Transcript_11790:213-599(-)|eukprot:scaffold102258_cov36-Tisochrysis_lutea.AAC.3